MGVDIVHNGRRETRIVQCGTHRGFRTRAFGMRRRPVVSVRSGPVADDLGEDRHTPGHRTLGLLEHHDAGAGAHDEPVAILVEWPRRQLGLVVARRQRARVAATGEVAASKAVVRTAGDHDVGETELDPARRLAE